MPFTSMIISISVDERHRVPISQMGNYQEVLKKQPPALRELESTPTRLHMFGNPFKVNKQVVGQCYDETVIVLCLLLYCGL